MKKLISALPNTLFVAFIILFFFWLLAPKESPSGWRWFGTLLMAIFTEEYTDN